MSVEDSSTTREILREIGRRPVDASALIVHVSHGVVSLRGRLERLRGYYDDLDLHEELQVILKVLRHKQGVRDVVCEVELGGETLAQRLGPHIKRHSY